MEPLSTPAVEAPYTFRSEAQAGGDIETRGFSGRAQAQHVGGLERGFLEAHGAVEHAGRRGAVHLQIGGPGGRRYRAPRIFRARPGAARRWARAWLPRSPWSR